MYNIIKEKIKFTPHYMMRPCYSCKFDNYRVNPIDCMSNGRYCTDSPSMIFNYKINYYFL